MEDRIVRNVDRAKRTAIHFCRRWSVTTQPDIDDMVGQALLTLVEVASAFDGRCGATFQTFLHRCIRDALYKMRRKEIINRKHWHTMDMRKLDIEPQDRHYYG